MKSQGNIFDSIWFPFSYYQDILDYPPIIIKNGKGIYLYDTNGKEYLDAIGSWWVSILGHSHPEISQAVKDQLDKIEHVIMAGFISEATLKLSGLLSSLLPKPLKRIFYSDDGSTAVEVALKMALQYWAFKGEPRNRFVALSGAYHGDTLGSMSVGMIPQYHSLFHRLFKKEYFVHSPYCYRCPVEKHKETCSADCMDSLEDLLRQKGDSIAAFIFEPMVQGAVGMRVYPSKVLRRIFDICQKSSVLTIADEVAMGFGRTGRLFACEHADAAPDIMCIAKGLTGGYLPLSATVVREEIFKEFCADYSTDRILNHGHSFTGNPLAASAACAALEIIKREDIPHSVERKMAYFREQLEPFSDLDIVGDVRSIGMVGALELVNNRETKEKLPPEKRIPFRISRRALKYGLLIRPVGDVIYFMPPYIISEEEIDSIFLITKKAIQEVLDEEHSTIRSHT